MLGTLAGDGALVPAPFGNCHLRQHRADRECNQV